MIINNVIALAKLAKVFNVPTILSTVIEERGGYLIKGLQDDPCHAWRGLVSLTRGPKPGFNL